MAVRNHGNVLLHSAEAIVSTVSLFSLMIDSTFAPTSHLCVLSAPAGTVTSSVCVKTVIAGNVHFHLK